MTRQRPTTRATNGGSRDPRDEPTDELEETEHRRRERMADVSHTPPHEGADANRVFVRGATGGTEDARDVATGDGSDDRVSSGSDE